MVKECKVLTNNIAITVIDYDGKQVQIPSIHREAATVKVIKEDNIYTVVADDYIEPKTNTKDVIGKTEKKTTKEKTTVKSEGNKNTSETVKDA